MFHLETRFLAVRLLCAPFRLFSFCGFCLSKKRARRAAWQRQTCACSHRWRR